MTREEAIKYLNEFILFKKISNTTEEEAVECFKLAVEALQQQPSEDEKVIRISKGTLKARQGRYVVYDVEWLKEHFNTTEAKICGQPSEDCISRKAVLDALHSCFAEGFNEDRWWNSTYVLDAINKVPSVTSQPNTEHIIKSTIKEYIDKDCDDKVELLLSLNKDLCERIRKENENGL